MSIERAWLVKGWLLAKDAPEPILSAIAEVIAGLSATGTVRPSVLVPQFSVAASGLANRVDPPVACPGPSDPEPPAALKLFDRDPDQFVTGREPAAVPPSDPEPKKRKPWTDEAREAAAERMRARQAAKRHTQPGEAPAPSTGGA